MTSASPALETRLEWSVASSPLEDGVSGDLHVVVETDSRTLLCVIDGLGHGRSARLAAQECESLIRARGEAPLLDIFRYCHEGLRETRGVVMTAVLIDAARNDLEWAGVGNVEAIVWRPDTVGGKACASVLTRGGVIGFRLPPLRSNRVTLAPGDLLVLVTDGIRGDFMNGIEPFETTSELARHLLQGFAKGSDDALVLVARYGAGAPV